MKTLLQIQSSIFSGGGQSSRLAERFVAAWRASNPGGKVIVRDLATEPVPHLDAARFGAFLAKPGERTSTQQAVVDYSDTLIDELKRADVVACDLVELAPSPGLHHADFTAARLAYKMIGMRFRE